VSPRTVVIVGAGLAGSRCAETLRAEGFDGRVVLIGEEPTPPYERPALSKEFLAGERERLDLRQPEFWAEQEIELVLGRRVERVDPAGLGGVEWDALVLATGARARRLPDLPASVHTLRTRADADALRAELSPGSRLGIVGAGFIGGEVASTARKLGVEVTLVDMAEAPLERVLGREVGDLLAARYEEHGVDLRVGTGLAGFVIGAGGDVSALELTDGSTVACDSVLLAIGAEPDGGLAAAGRDGIPTDECGRTSFTGVYACGDVANTLRPSLGRQARVEHWTSAAGQAAAVARAILGRETPYDDVPYFWSDQFGLRLQHVGHAEHWRSVEIEGDSESFSARYVGQDGTLAAALLVNRPREIGAVRRELAPHALQEAA
jgi:3-phenylpropionate/trans-cinnamate dioxygenase ferredoxin reductase component